MHLRFANVTLFGTGVNLAEHVTLYPSSRRDNTMTCTSFPLIDACVPPYSFSSYLSSSGFAGRHLASSRSISLSVRHGV